MYKNCFFFNSFGTPVHFFLLFMILDSFTRFLYNETEYAVIRVSVFDGTVFKSV